MIRYHTIHIVSPFSLQHHTRWKIWTNFVCLVEYFGIAYLCCLRITYLKLVTICILRTKNLLGLERKFINCFSLKNTEVILLALFVLENGSKSTMDKEVWQHPFFFIFTSMPSSSSLPACLLLHLYQVFVGKLVQLTREREESESADFNVREIEAEGREKVRYVLGWAIKKCLDNYRQYVVGNRF